MYGMYASTNNIASGNASAIDYIAAGTANQGIGAFNGYRSAVRGIAEKTPQTIQAGRSMLFAGRDANAIANGHAFEKHVLGVGNPSGAPEFDGISTVGQFANHIKGIMTSKTAGRAIQGDTQVYFDGKTIVFRNPSHSDSGTAFVPGPTDRKPNQTPQSYWNDLLRNDNVIHIRDPQ